MRTAKFKLLTTTFVTSALILGACGDNNDDKAETELNENELQKQEEATSEQDTAVETPEIEPQELEFETFDLTIDTADEKDAVVAKYSENNNDSVYTNELDSTNIKQEEAHNLLHNVLSELQLTKDMSDEDVIERVKLAFGIEDYTNFNLDIGYNGEDEVKSYTDSKE